MWHHWLDIESAGAIFVSCQVVFIQMAWDSVCPKGGGPWGLAISGHNDILVPRGEEEDPHTYFPTCGFHLGLRCKASGQKMLQILPGKWRRLDWKESGALKCPPWSTITHTHTHNICLPGWHCKFHLHSNLSIYSHFWNVPFDYCFASPAAFSLCPLHLMAMTFVEGKNVHKRMVMCWLVCFFPLYTFSTSLVSILQSLARIHSLYMGKHLFHLFIFCLIIRMDNACNLWIDGPVLSVSLIPPSPPQSSPQFILSLPHFLSSLKVGG